MEGEASVSFMVWRLHSRWSRQNRRAEKVGGARPWQHPFLHSWAATLISSIKCCCGEGHCGWETVTHPHLDGFIFMRWSNKKTAASVFVKEKKAAFPGCFLPAGCRSLPRCWALGLCGPYWSQWWSHSRGWWDRSLGRRPKWKGWMSDWSLTRGRKE